MQNYSLRDIKKIITIKINIYIIRRSGNNCFFFPFFKLQTINLKIKRKF